MKSHRTVTLVVLILPKVLPPLSRCLSSTPRLRSFSETFASFLPPQFRGRFRPGGPGPKVLHRTCLSHRSRDVPGRKVRVFPFLCPCVPVVPSPETPHTSREGEPDVWNLYSSNFAVLFCPVLLCPKFYDVLVMHDPTWV